ncbi:hypothetical protein M1D46_09700 [Microbacterium sp. JZ70]
MTSLNSLPSGGEFLLSALRARAGPEIRGSGGWPDALANDLHLIVFDPDDQAAEVRGDEVSTYRIGGALVEATGLAEKVDVRECRVGTVLKAVERDIELFLDCFRLEGRALDTFADLRDRKCAGCRELDEAFLLRLKLSQLLGELCFGVAVGREEVVDRGLQVSADAVDGVGVKAFAGYDGRDLGFDLLDAEPRGPALAALLGGADEVLVSATVARVLAVNHAAGAPGIEAFPAEDHALQVVEVDDVAVALAVTVIKDFLDLQEGLL